MAKVKLVTRDNQLTSAGVPSGERSTGNVSTRTAISEGFPLHADFRILDPGAAIAWEDVGSGLVVYVWAGAARIGDVALAQGSAVVIEHRASVRIEATGAGCELLVFDSASVPPPADSPGGQVHVLPAERVQRKSEYHPGSGVGVAIFADASCPNCRLWLHENTYRADYALGLHSHSEDEIIVVTAGEIIVGNRRGGRGTMLAIAANVKYGFQCGPQGMQFINFRASHPTYTPADGGVVLDEARFFREIFKAPPPFLHLT